MLFQDSDGHPIKFFLQQRDISPEDLAEVRLQISQHGGSVEDKVPLAGYVLVHVGTAEADRLRQCWETPERPNRHVLHMTFVRTSIEAGRIFPQVFRTQQGPLKIRLHDSLANINVRSQMCYQIMACGGMNTEDEESAHVIVADDATSDFRGLQKKYVNNPKYYVENIDWLNRCIDNGILSFTPLVRRNLGGRIAGSKRTEFSPEDDHNLAWYLAQRIPFKEQGGRTGVNVYKELVENPDQYPWAHRHTWSSWRERYKKRPERLDPMINAFVEKAGTVQGQKGQYGLTYPTPPKQKTQRKKRISNLPDVPAAVAVGSAAGPSALPTALPGDQWLTQGAGEARDPLFDAEEDWRIREGNLPPPAWANANGKRARAEEGEEGDDDVDDANELSHIDPALHTAGPVHDDLAQIAHAYSFTVDEVSAYHTNKAHGDIESTRRRFQRARAMLDSLDEGNEA